MIPQIKKIVTLINKKVDKIDGKQLSSNDFTDEYKKKIDDTADFIVEEGSNTDGNYIKYNSGLMICYKKLDFSNIEKSRNFNGFYNPQTSLNLGNFAKPFIEIPTVSITLVSTFSVLYMGDINPTKSDAGTFYPLGFDSGEIASMTANVTAYGKWK